MSGERAPDDPLAGLDTSKPISIDALVGKYGALPASLKEKGFDVTGVTSTKTESGEWQITGDVVFPLGAPKPATLALTIVVSPFSIAGDLTPTGTAGDLTFRVAFAPGDGSPSFLATLVPPDPKPSVKQIVAAFLPNVAAHIPDGMTIPLADAALIAGKERAVLVDFGVPVDPEKPDAEGSGSILDLARLPLAGEHLDAGLGPLRVVAAPGGVGKDAVEGLNLLLGTIEPLPEDGLETGVTVGAALRLGTAAVALSAVFGAEPPAAPASEDSSDPPPAHPDPAPTIQRTPDGAVWYRAQRSFGPLTVDRIGMALRDSDGTSVVALLLDATLALGPLTMALDGLELGLTLTDHPKAEFDLAGMGLSWSSGPVSISGAFLQDKIEYGGKEINSYGGDIEVRTAELGLSAIGMYATLPALPADDERKEAVPGGPSLFVYVALDYPIGGPPFLFVNGLAAGFGYNRRFVAPDVSAIGEFPLVTAATGGDGGGDDLGGTLEKLGTALPPSVGDIFLAVGVRAQSFGMLDSFLLLAATVGHRFELDVLGLSTLTLPAPVGEGAQPTAIAEVQLAVLASFAPEEGVLLVQAQLTPNSFVLSRACRLEGGFAFGLWFGSNGHAGDFVLSAGGYHPQFAIPAHYPAVPRLGLDWQVSPELAVTGGGYFALTPGMLMAGVGVRATWDGGKLKASFDASMDFLLGWHPFHYQVTAHVAVSASYTYRLCGTHTISVHVGADLELAGPEFHGTATIDLDIVSVTVRFGPQHETKPSLPWSKVRDTLLPKRDHVVTITVGGGATGSATGNDARDLGVLDPGRLVLRLSTAVPLTDATREKDRATLSLGTGGAGGFGVRPSGNTRVARSTCRLEITHFVDGVASTPDPDFTCTPVLQNLPAALWGDGPLVDASAPGLQPNLLTGYTISPPPPDKPDDRVRLTAAALTRGDPVYTATGAVGFSPPTAIPGDPVSTVDGRWNGSTTGPDGIRTAVLAAVLTGAADGPVRRVRTDPTPEVVHSG